MSIRPDNLNLDKLLQNRLFRIPEYQRAYSWETKQRKELFDDIKKLAENSNTERRHFMSTVICLQTDKKELIDSDEFGIFDIVDGQQRITTLIILLKALAKEFEKGNEKDNKQSSKINEILVKDDGRHILLQTNHDNKLLLRNYLEKGEVPEEKNLETLADKNMIAAFNECEKFIAEWKQDNQNIISLLRLVKNRLEFIYYVLDDEGTVHRIFEVVNSRGLEVDWLDKCKSILMGIACEKLEAASQESIVQIHESWSKIYKKIGLKKIEGQEILRFAAVLEDSSETGRSRIISAEDAIELFRKKCQENPKTTIDVSDNFLKIAQKLEKLVTNKRLKAVTKILHTRLLATAIMLNEFLEKQEKEKLLKEWEKITFRIFGLGRRDARTKVGEYVNLARDIFQTKILEEEQSTEKRIKFQDKEYNIDKRDEIIKEINNKISDLGKESEYQVDKVVSNLKDTNCYESWQEELIYFLYRYEEQLASQSNVSISDDDWEKIWNSSSAKTIEHIHPQKPNDNNDWRGKLGTKKDYIERQTQRLGNLIILPPGVNSKAGNKPFQEKKEIYEKHRSLKILDEVIALDDWNETTLKEREERLIEFAKQEWA